MSWKSWKWWGKLLEGFNRANMLYHSWMAFEFKRLICNVDQTFIIKALGSQKKMARLGLGTLNLDYSIPSFKRIQSSSTPVSVFLASKLQDTRVFFWCWDLAKVLFGYFSCQSQSFMVIGCVFGCRILKKVAGKTQNRLKIDVLESLHAATFFKFGNRKRI